MRIGIYNEPSGGSPGGSDYAVAVLAEALRFDHQVEIVHHRPSFTSEKLSELSGTNLSNVKLRYAEPQPYLPSSSLNLFSRYRNARRWHRFLSEPYDLFINFTHTMPPFCYARKGVLMVLFPNSSRYTVWPWQPIQVDVNHNIRGRLSSLYYEREWANRIRSYQAKTAISEFTRTWTRRRWGFDCDVTYVPVNVNVRPSGKANSIISVGRFATEGHSKKQFEMVTTFCEMKALIDWNYYCVGALSDKQPDKDYFDTVRRAAGCDRRIKIFANIGRQDLHGLYNSAKIFWHATGYGEGEANPELAEHFGIVTVEAMASGCIPIVINKGGQPEIVQHGVSGYLWNTLDELKEYTLSIMRDEALRRKMSEAARARAHYFSSANFVRRFLEATRHLLPS